MSEMIVLEVHFFLGSFLSGVLVAAAYDILRFLRLLVPHSRGVINGEDIFFWTGASFFIFQVIYQLNDGKIRSLGMLCMTVGMMLYHYSLSRPLLEFCYKVFGTSFLKVLKFFKKALKKMAKPFRIGVQMLKKLFRRRHENRQEDKKNS